MHRVRLALSVVLTLLAGATATLVGTSAPRAAATPLWANEQAMINSTYERDTFVFDPGVGNTMTPAQFAEPGLVSFYAKVGFDRNFMYWAPIEDVPAPNAYWADCYDHANTGGGLCPVAPRFLGQQLISQEFDPGATVHLKVYNGAFIGTACGNYGQSGGTGPVPHITGIKYDDLNGDGVQEANEPGLPGWTIDLSYDGFVVASTTTGPSGTYSFALDADTLPIGAGTYSVTEELQPGWTQSQAPTPIQVNYGIGDATFSGADFGNWHTASISGRKFEDMNADGSGSGDPGLPGWTIRYAGAASGTAITGSDGDYQLGNLRPGTYTVSEVQQPGWNQSLPGGVGSYTVTVVSGQNFTGLDFGNWQSATISGRKFDDVGVDGSGVGDPGIAGWMITLDNTSTELTQSDGSYSFSGLAPGTYTVGEVQRAGWRQTTPTSGSATVNVTSGEELTGIDFGNVCLGTINVEVPAGVGVRIDQISVPGILMNSPSLPLSGSGASTFAGLLPGTYRVTLTLPDGIFSTDPDLTSIDGTFAIVKTVGVEECADVTVAPPIVHSGSGKITGGVRIAIPDGYATSGFEFMQATDGPRGTLEYNDHVSDQKIHTSDITGIYVAGDAAYIFGNVTIGGTSYPFRLHLVDAGEPGINDQFGLVVGNGYSAGTDETISDGNVQLH